MASQVYWMGQKESFEDKKDLSLWFLKQQKYLLDEESKKTFNINKIYEN